MSLQYSLMADNIGKKKQGNCLGRLRVVSNIGERETGQKTHARAKLGAPLGRVNTLANLLNKLARNLRVLVN